MTKTRWLGLAALVGVVVLGVAAVWVWPPAEPIYKGQPLHYWLRGYAPPTSASSSNPAPGPTREEADEAVRALGTNAIPDLLRMIVYRPSPLMPPLLEVGRWLHIVEGQDVNPYARNHEALRALQELGYKAAGATPELMQMYDAYPDPSSQTSVLFALGCVGPKAKAALPLLLRATTNASELVRINAARALGAIHAGPAFVVPALALCLRDQSPLVRWNAISELRGLGEKARPAVPALLQLLRDEKYDPAVAPAPPQQPHEGSMSIYGGFSPTQAVAPPTAALFRQGCDLAGSAASALWRIDPDAADKAHLKRPNSTQVNK
jgi:hypothetical protein